MRKLTTPLKYAHVFAVKGKDTRGLLDCMRYDRATFYEQVDAHTFEQACYGGKFEEFNILLIRFTETKVNRLSSQWKSCHLEVTEMKDGEEYQFKRS